MRGAFVRSHYIMRLAPPEAGALRRVLEDVRTIHSNRDDDTFVLNDLELEVVDEVIEALGEGLHVSD